MRMLMRDDRCWCRSGAGHLLGLTAWSDPQSFVMILKPPSAAPAQIIAKVRVWTCNTRPLTSLWRLLRTAAKT